MGSKKARFEAIMDVGPIIISHVKNPVQEEGLQFLKDVLKGKILCLIPVSVFLGAYIIMTKYLRVRRDEAKNALRKTLSLNLDIFYEDIPKNIVLDALEDASKYKISSWDAYIAQIAKIHQIRIVYTLDLENFEKIPWLKPLLPISTEAFMQYQKWVRKITTGL